MDIPQDPDQLEVSKAEVKLLFINWIVQSLNDASDFFYALYREVYGWVSPFWHAADIFYQLYLIFNDLAWSFYDFGQWVDYATDQLGDILSWSNIRTLILSWLPDIEDVVDWWNRWRTWVTEALNDWWQATKDTVIGWISYATGWLSDWIDSLESALITLKAAWDEWSYKIPSFDMVWRWFTDWQSKVLAHIITWGALPATGINSLIDSWFKAYTPFWAGWQDVKDNVFAFFASPLDWLLDRFTDWFLGPEA